MASNWSISHAVKIIQQGGVIAYPTESVFGLGCDPGNLQAVAHLLALKNRSYHKGLILVASDLTQATPYLAPLSQAMLRQINTSKNKHITWLLPARDDVSPLLCGDFPASRKKMAIRITHFPLIKALCEQLASPIVSTSANLSGKKMTYSVLQIRQQFHTSLT